MNLDHLLPLSAHKHLKKAAAGARGAGVGSMIAWSMKSSDLNSRNPQTKTKCGPVTGERMSLKYKLPKGHLTANPEYNQTRGSWRGARHAAFSPRSQRGVYFEESPSSSCDILLFLDFKCIKREPAYIDVVNQYCWRGELMLRCQVFHSKLTHFNRLRAEQQLNLLTEHCVSGIFIQFMSSVEYDAFKCLCLKEVMMSHSLFIFFPPGFVSFT